MEQKKKFKYRVEEGDTIENLSLKFNTSKEGILRNNDKIKLYVGEIVEITQNEFKIHIVKPAESLKSIAEKYNVSIENLYEMNNLNDDRLFIGQILKICIDS